jgi:ABC-type uncharacterized transport system auxiliary subunit
MRFVKEGLIRAAVVLAVAALALLAGCANRPITNEEWDAGRGQREQWDRLGDALDDLARTLQAPYNRPTIVYNPPVIVQQPADYDCRTYGNRTRCRAQ